MTAQLHNFSSLEEASSQLAIQVGQWLGQSLRKHSRACMAVPGGTTPGAFLRALASQPLEWDSISVLPTDERWVEETHPRSNLALIRSCLHPVTKPLHLLSFYDDRLQPNEAQKTVGMAVKTLFAENHPAVCVLGMGEDGHFASLFPDNPLLEEGLTTHHRALAVTHQGEIRISLTAAAIKRFQHIALLIQGKSKRELIAGIMQGEQPHLPVARLFSTCTVEVYQG